MCYTAILNIYILLLVLKRIGKINIRIIVSWKSGYSNIRCCHSHAHKTRHCRLSKYYLRGQSPKKIAHGTIFLGSFGCLYLGFCFFIGSFYFYRLQKHFAIAWTCFVCWARVMTLGRGLEPKIWIPQKYSNY